MAETTVKVETTTDDVKNNPQFEEAVATLSSILNHEICKPLSTIMSNVQILLHTAGQCDAETRERLEEIEAATRAIRRSACELAANSRATHDIVAS